MNFYKIAQLFWKFSWDDLCILNIEIAAQRNCRGNCAKFYATFVIVLLLSLLLIIFFQSTLEVHTKGLVFVTVYGTY